MMRPGRSTSGMGHDAQGEDAAKLARLREALSKMGGTLIAFSGGVDSAFLVRVAVDVLGDRVLAVTARSPSYPDAELEAAKDLAARLGVRHLVVDTAELSDPRFTSNSPERCYWCKKTLFGMLFRLAEAEGLPYVLDGSNLDDGADFRPGSKAALELGVRSPLKEAGLTKAAIRRLSRQLGLPTWDKPAAACLASRFPYGRKITAQDLERVEMAEAFLKTSGFAQVRVRHHGTMARIEVDASDMFRLVESEFRQQLSSFLKSLGYVYVAVDLDGYRSGSMNEVLFGEVSRFGSSQ